MKIAILFRGPIRPTPATAFERYLEFMSHFTNSDIEVHTYLATWRMWKNYKACDLISLNLFDNVIMQTAPTEAHRLRCTKLVKLPNGADIEPVFNMYYQSKTALDLIVNSDNYDYIIHTRPDMKILIEGYLDQWFDPNFYVAPHVHPKPWMNDQFGIAPSVMMHKAWDYGDIGNLGKLIEQADKPEAVLQTMIDQKGIPVKAGQYKIWQLDPRRNN